MISGVLRGNLEEAKRPYPTHIFIVYSLNWQVCAAKLPQTCLHTSSCQTEASIKACFGFQSQLESMALIGMASISRFIASQMQNAFSIPSPQHEYVFNPSSHHIPLKNCVVCEISLPPQRVVFIIHPVLGRAPGTRHWRSMFVFVTL